MASKRLATLLLVVGCGVVAAEDLPELPKGCLASGVDPQCYTAGNVTGAVVGTFLVTLALLALGYAIYRMYWRGRRGKHLVLVTDPERGVTDEYAFDNPCFRDGTPIGRGGYEKEPVKLDQKNRWSAWSPLGALVGNRNEKRRALDDSFTGEPQVNIVSLRSHDFTGLGFNVCGNMRDGIFVKDVLHRGPASESGRITSGDRIDSIRISFRHMVFEDALTILSYASPYEVQLEVENPSPSSRPSTLIRTKRSSIEPADRICHPFYRSQSIADLAQIGKSSLKHTSDMGDNKSPKSKNELWDESRAGDYPTLKLSPLPLKETIKLEKTASPSSPAAAAIVKPERAKKAPVLSPDNAHSGGSSTVDVKPDSASKHQKFGIRVLPESKGINQLKKTTEDVKSSTVSAKKPDNVVNVSKGSPTLGGDTRMKTSNILEAERRENERNSMVEQTGGVPTTNKAIVVSSNVNIGKVSPVVSIDIVDAGHVQVNPLTYDERGIDVGPAEEEENRRRASLGVEPATKGEEGSKKTSDSTDGHSNVKLLLTKGLQNLKEKLHHHDKKKMQTIPPPEPHLESNVNSNDSKKSDSGKGIKKGKTVESAEIDGAKEKVDKKPIDTENKLKEIEKKHMDTEKKPKETEKMQMEAQTKIVEPEKKTAEPVKKLPESEKQQLETSNLSKQNGVKEQKEKSSTEEVESENSEGKIPTEIPEEVRRAAMAARNNRRSSGYIPPDTQVLTVSQDSSQNPKDGQTMTEDSNGLPVDVNSVSNYPPVKYRVRPQESLSEDSSGDDLGAGTSGSNDSIGRAPKRSNKRKAPVPPLKDTEDIVMSDDVTTLPQVIARVSESVLINGKENPVQRLTADSIVNIITKQVNTIINDNVQTMEVHVDTDKNLKFANVPRQQNSPSACNEITNIAVESVSSVQPSSSPHTQETGTSSKSGDVNNELTIAVDNPHSMKINNTNSDSDSDDDKDVMLSSRKRNKKGGTTIELNSSHITIHHSPTSDIVTLELEGDSTRKAASMGDLSRLDTQPMSVLERAVSLDLADGGTPHSSKKRKAPLPPPGDEYLNTVQDSDDGGVYRKEPRLDNALDTFQRRRLKKSSDWGTMEDAVQQGSPPLSPRKSLTSPTNILVGAYDNEPTSLTISIGEDDSEVFMESLPHQGLSDVEVPHISSNPVPSARTFDMAGRAYILPSSDTDTGYSSISLRGMENTPESSVNGLDSLGSKRTVLRITPEPSIDVISSSQVTLTQEPSSGPSSMSTGLLRSNTPEVDTEVSGSRLLGFLQGEYKNNVHSSGDDSVMTPNISQSTETHTIISSTPIVNRDHAHFRQHMESLQSPQVTSSDGGIRNINVVSSSTQVTDAYPSDQDMNISNVSNISGISGINSTFDDDSNISVTSTSEQFITATGNVDSTTTGTFVGMSEDDDVTIGQDSPPPELPTSPMPILTSTYNPSSSLTYITEIQVTTVNPKQASEPQTESHNGNEEGETDMVVSSMARSRSLSISPDSMGSDTEDTDMDAALSGGNKAVNGGYGQQRNNVTVTAIRTADRSRIPTRVGNEPIMTTFQSPSAAAVERSQIPLRVGTDGLLTTFQSQAHAVNFTEPTNIPMRMSSGGVLTTFQNTATYGNAERSQIPTRIVSPGSQETSPVGNNGIGEKKSKPVRPPVPPRKSDSSMSSVITVEVPNSNQSPENAQRNSLEMSYPYSSYGSSSNSQNTGAKKFISFSSLTPRPVSGEGSGRNSSFEQWVFLDDNQGHATNGNAHNGQETAGDENMQHSTSVTLPVSLSNRPPSVTHIVLDSKQSSGKRGSQ